MAVSPRPDPNLKFSGSVIVRDEYMAQCSGVYLINNVKNGIIVNFMEGERNPTQLPPLSNGWRAVALMLSPADAEALGRELLRRAGEVKQEAP